MNTLHIQNQTFDAERALYGSRNVLAERCRFDGPADGESAYKESRDITARDCYFNLRYPFWHDHTVSVERCEMTELCRAALWYCDDVRITDSRLYGIKALRECRKVQMEHCDVVSEEFGWMSHGVTMRDCQAKSAYFMLNARDLTLENVRLEGKYSFQYVENAIIRNCDFQTKDSFWHAKHVRVTDSTIRGEYLAWYCEDVTFERCHIVGTQPLCYCKGLTLIDCTMEDADLAFEKSEVQATLTAPMISIKNPAAGQIILPRVGEIIMDDPAAAGNIIIAEDETI